MQCTRESEEGSEKKENEGGAEHNQSNGRNKNG